MKHSYRADIDGLRAIAVISVILFHYFPDQLTGGFVGVDIFFVISGYLITGIMITGLNEGTFRFRTFYANRIRRIFPALLIILYSCFIGGWLFLLHNEQRDLGKAIADGVGFISNITLAGQGGYFDTATALRPLMHLWSLGIEEQFYLAWPLVVYSLWKKRYGLLSITLVIIILSFLANILSIHDQPAKAFYYPQMRFWELLSGALLAISPIELRKEVSWLGILLLLIAITCVDKESLFPGWLALIPVAGSCLIIASRGNQWLAHPILVWIGLISYPLYLWHWPILSLMHITHGTLSPGIRVILLIATTILAWLTYIVIEKPIRFGPRSIACIITLCSLMGAIGLAGYCQKNGFLMKPDPYSAFEDYFENYYRLQLAKEWHEECNFHDLAANRKKVNIAPSCYTPHSNQRVFLWGDSQAQHYMPGLAYLPPQISLLQVTTSGCKPYMTPQSFNHLGVCNESNQFALTKIKELKPDIVIIAQRDHHERTDFEATARYLHTLGVRHVILMGPVPQWDMPLYKVIIRNYWEHPLQRIATNHLAEIFTTDQLLKEKYAASNDITLLSPIDFFCNQEGCISYVGNVGSDKKSGLTTFDYGHLTLIASRTYAHEILIPEIMKLLKEDD